MIQNGFMTPAVNNNSQFSQGVSNKIAKNTNALMAMSGVKEPNIQQIKEQAEDAQSQIMEQTEKAGGTGAADDDNFEDDCIASFSDEQDDD